MAKAQHRTPEYKRAEVECRRLVLSGAALCVEPRCLFPTRAIPAWFDAVKPRLWSVSHDTTGTIVLGPSHKRCNLSEAAIRGNRARARRRRRLVL
jgi:hypothetical protein